MHSNRKPEINRIILCIGFELTLIFVRNLNLCFQKQINRIICSTFDNSSFIFSFRCDGHITYLIEISKRIRVLTFFCSVSGIICTAAVKHLNGKLCLEDFLYHNRNIQMIAFFCITWIYVIHIQYRELILLVVVSSGLDRNRTILVNDQ